MGNIISSSHRELLYHLIAVLVTVECSAKAEHYLDDCIIDLAKPPTASLSVQGNFERKNSIELKLD